MTHHYTVVLLASLAALVTGSLAVACSSSSTTINPSNNPDAGSTSGGAAAGGGSSAAQGGTDSASGGATSTAANCFNLGETGCTSTCCESGTDCVSDKCVVKTTRANGESCTGPAMCTVRTCLAGTCGPPACRSNVADSCNSDFPCCTSTENDAGTGGLFCDALGKCQKLMTAGKACSDSLPCDTGLYCYSVSSTCQPYGANGAPCSSTLLCGSGLTCNSTSNTCATCTGLSCIAIGIRPIILLCARKAVGESCTSPADCCSGNCGVDQKCHAACLALGGLCSGAADCCSGECLNNTCVYSSCRAAGTACYADINCCSNHCGTNALCQ
jgi:hypothetical protein